MWLSHISMPAASNKHYILWLCYCRAHCRREYAFAKYNMGRLVLPWLPTRVVLASAIPVTVQLRCVPLLQQLSVCHLASPTIPTTDPVLPHESSTTLPNQNRAVLNNNNDHAGNRAPQLFRLHSFAFLLKGSKGWARPCR